MEKVKRKYHCFDVTDTASFIAVHDMTLYVVVMIWRQSLGDAVARLRVEVLVVVVGGVLRVLLINAALRTASKYDAPGIRAGRAA